MYILPQHIFKEINFTYGLVFFKMWLLKNLKLYMWLSHISIGQHWVGQLGTLGEGEEFSVMKISLMSCTGKSACKEGKRIADNDKPKNLGFGEIRCVEKGM